MNIQHLKINEISDLLIEHYASKSPCNWGVIIKFSKDFGKCPLNAIQFYHDKCTSIKPIIRLLRTHHVYILNIKRNDEFTHTITIMNHTTEN
jgi:hypothetical protein